MRCTLYLWLVAITLGGCTTQATHQAIHDYHRTQQQQAAAFANTYRTAQENVFLAASLKLRHTHNEDERHRALVAYAQAVQGINDMRVQYERAIALSLSTVGMYLYDRQGPLNVMFEDHSSDLDSLTGAILKGNDAASVESILDIYPSANLSDNDTERSLDVMLNSFLP